MDSNQKKHLFNEITVHLLNDAKPSLYINTLSEQEEFNQYPFDMLVQLQSTEQSAKYHPEGNVWNHTMLVVDEAAKVRERSKEPKAFMWAALIHDIGKPGTTRIRKGKISSYDHDKVGERLSKEFLQALTEEDDFIRKVSDLVRYHMHMLYILKNLPYADRGGLINNLAEPDELALLCKCDRLGRTGAAVDEVEQEYREFLDRLRNIFSRQL